MSRCRGIRAVRRRGDVLLTTRAWHIDSEPTFSPAVLKEAKWAAATGDMSAERPWSLDLTVERPENVPVPCLALAAVNAAFRPGAEFHLQVDGETCSLASRFWNTQGKRPLYGYYVQLTGRWPLTEDDPDFGLLRNDVVGHYYITIPPDDVLARCTIEYQDVFTADQEQLRRWLGQRIVIMGDLRTGVDRHPYPDGREVSGVYSHAAAIEAMSRYSAVRTPTENEAWVIISVAVLAGGLVALFLHRSLAKLGFLTLAMIVLAGLFAVEAYRDFGYLANPTVPRSVDVLLVTATRRRALNGFNSNRGEITMTEEAAFPQLVEITSIAGSAVRSAEFALKLTHQYNGVRCVPRPEAIRERASKSMRCSLNSWPELAVDHGWSYLAASRQVTARAAAQRLGFARA